MVENTGYENVAGDMLIELLIGSAINESQWYCKIRENAVYGTGLGDHDETYANAQYEYFRDNTDKLRAELSKRLNS